jgi:predicted RNA-binding protein Jag
MKIQEYLEKTIKHMGVDSDFEIVLEENDDQLQVMIEVSQDDVALLIGNGGETLESLELLTKLSFKDEYEGKKISLDVNGYRKNQRERFVEDLLETAREVMSTGREQTIRDLNSFERFLAHNAISSSEELQSVESFSKDEDGRRTLVIRLKPEVA